MEAKLEEKVTLLREFAGFISADIPELHAVEVPRIGESVERFLRASAPAAPVTVTVTVVNEWTSQRRGYFQDRGGNFTPYGDEWTTALHRIASDARRIEELERELDETKIAYSAAKFGRDEARRALADFNALAQLEAATSQGEGPTGGVTEHSPQVQEGGAGSTPAQSVPSPAPIPLGAVVESVEYAYRFARYTHDWECMQGDPPVGHPVDVEVSALCTALYRALHPVADAATVKRVALRVKQYNGPTAVSAEGFARIILEELGYTIQEREA